MPFRSQAQWRWAFATNQEFADEWAKLTPGGKRRYELLRRRVEKKQSLKHLPGRHNQQSHGRRGGGGGGGVGGSSASIGKFNDWNQREIDRIEQTMQRVNDWVKRVDKPNYSDDEIEQLRSAFQKALGTQSGESDLQFVRFLRDAKRLGLTVEEAQTIIRNRDIMKSFRKGVVNISEETVSKALLSDHYNEQRIRISRMDKDTQQQMLDEITSKPKSERTQWDYDRAAALTIYADPEVRWNSMRFMADNYSDANRNRVLAGKTIFDGRDDVGSPYKTMQFYSLDYRLYNVLDQAGLANVPYSQIFGSGDAVFNNFMQTFSYTHTSQSTENVLGAQIQYAVSQVGANANAPRPPSFFPRGVKTPTSNPEIQRLLNMQYEATQQRLAGSKPLDLYRGQNADFALGIPMSPWSDQKRVAIGFAMRHSEGKRILNSARVSNQYIFMDHNDPNWRSTFYDEREYLVQETALVYRSKKQQMGEVYDQQTGNRYENVTWTEKAITSQIPEPNSYLEDQYDIFYNYRVKPKKQTRREKALVRLKHLPGRHNQQAHGRRGGTGGGSAGEIIGKFNSWNQREIARIEETMERVGRVLHGNAPGSTFTQDEIARLEILAIGSGLKNFDVFLEDAQKHGLTVDEVQTIMRHTLSNKSKYIDSWALNPQIAATALLSDHYNEQRIRISQMNKDTQQQMLDDISSKPKKQRTQWDYDRAAALTIYADPEVRWNALQFMFSNENDASRVREVSGFETSDTSVGIRSSWATMQYYSLDFRLYDTLKKTKGNVSYSELLGSSTEDSFQQFMKAFSYTHTSQNTSNVMGAQIQYAVSQVGPNANAPRPPSFFPRGVKTPTSNPEVQRLLNMQYQETQRRISTDDASLYDKPNTLYRGQRPNFNIGIPMGPWSDVKSVAVGFATDVDNGNLNIAQMPREFIFMDHRDPNWQTKYSFESEYLILETSFVRKSRSKKVGKMTNPIGGKQYEEVEWTEKAIMVQIPEPNSYLEDQYDIFYNYRKKPKKSKQTRREKALVRLKADFEARGNTPGRRWSAGAGEVITGDLARDESGRFTSASGGRAGRAIATTRQEMLRSGGAKKPKRSQQSPEQQQAQRRKLGEDGMKKLGYESSDFAIIDNSSPQSPDDPAVQKLIDRGLMEIVNGKAYPTSLGRKIAKAVGRGNIDTAQESIDRDIQKRSDRAEQKRNKLQSQIDDLTDRLEEQKGKTKARTQRRIDRLKSELQSVSTKSSESFSPPASVRSAAARGLELRKKFGRGGTMVGVARARDLSNGKSIPLATIKRMVSFFARHSVDERPNWSDPSNPTNGYIAHLLWGGDAGRSWANSISKRMDKEN